MVLNEVLASLVEKENAVGLDNLDISKIPVWSVLKYDIRRKYLLKNGFCESLQSSKSKIDIIESSRGLFQSFCGFHKQLLKPTISDNFIMGFSRLDYIEDKYIDRFIDPVVEMSNLKDNYICFEYGRVGIHRQPRKNIERVIYTDYIYMLSFFIGYVMAFAFLCVNYHSIRIFRKKIIDASSLALSLLWLARKIVEFKANVAIFSILLSRVKAKRVFGVSRILFKHVAFAAKKKEIPVYEFQHGITLGNTELYSGNYIQKIDPDYFLAFGESCPKDVFGIPSEKVINIGWAFNSYLKKISRKKKKENCCLVISEPQITNQIIDVTLLLAKKYPQINFHIRRHPQESFTEEQKGRFSNIENVSDQTNDVNSFVVSMEYDYIIGENSTVLFEGLSLGKKIARLNICELHPSLRKSDDSFYYIDSLEDFGYYLKAPYKTPKEPIYSKFNSELFNSFLE